AVASPAGRFLQWKAILHANGVVGSVAVNYLPVNAAPVVDDLVIATGARVNPQTQFTGQPQTVSIAFGASASASDGATTDISAAVPLTATKDRTAITVRWSAHDDNGDTLVYSLYLRGDGESVWRLLKKKITEKAYSFDSTLIPDGGYQVKVVASDAPSHSPGDALTSEKISDRFEVDTTPPVITALKAVRGTPCSGAPCSNTLLVSFDAVDSFSPIARAEYSLDAGPWQFLEPVDKISDSRTEHYDFSIAFNEPAGKTSEHLITVRAYDRYDNVGVAKTVIPAAEE
ncbi:MAG: fibronectin type III domain-containing protein, partial [Terracidiphilus sp.]